MALTDPGVGRTVEFGLIKVEVTLARACRAGDILGIAADNWDDMGPIYGADDAHSTSVAYVARLVAGEDGAASDVICAYGFAVVSGYSSCAVFNKVYVAAASGDTGELTETISTASGDNADVIGMSIATNRVVLFPLFGGTPEASVAS